MIELEFKLELVVNYIVYFIVKYPTSKIMGTLKHHTVNQVIEEKWALMETIMLCCDTTC